LGRPSSGFALIDLRASPLDLSGTFTGRAAGFTAITGALIYLRVCADDLTPAGDIPLVWFDFAATPNGGDLTLQFSTSPSEVFTIS
jgi:hypothetical protein